MSRLALIFDGNFMCQSVWHTSAGRTLSTKDGRPSGVVHGVLTGICMLWAKLKPDALFIVWDRKSRHRTALIERLKAESPDAPAVYKEGRYSDPQAYNEYQEILKPQMAALAKVLPHAGFRSLVVDGVEGDDLIGIAADSLLAQGYRSITVSTDKDLYQLLCDGVEIYNPKSKRLITDVGFKETYDLEPTQWPEVRALCGDDGDAIPGVPGIGEKTALKLIQKAPLLYWLECDPDNEPLLEKKLVKHVKKAQSLRMQVMTAYDLSYILSSYEQLDPDQTTTFSARWVSPSIIDVDEVRRFIDFYELVSAGAKLMDLMTGTVLASVRTIPELWQKWGNCMRCPLHKTRSQIVYSSGPDDAAAVFLGEGPGGSEDFQGVPFVGLAGQYLDKMFAYAGINRQLVRLVNAVMCLPRDGSETGTPSAGEIAACRPRLQTELKLIRPKVVVLLGGSALKAVFPSAGIISDERGTIKTHADFPGVRFFPTFHPSYLMRLPQGVVGPSGMHGGHSDIVRAREDWKVIAQMIKEAA